MFKKLLVLFAVLLGVSGMAAAQRSLTNADLEKYREARLRADRDYRQNYEKLGMPSPEELDRRRADHLYEVNQLASRLRTERLEEERLDLQRYEAERAARVIASYGVPQSGQFYSDSFIYPYGGYFNNGRYSRSLRGGRYLPQQQGYFAGGQFWPTGSATRARPMIRIGAGSNGGHRR